MFICLDLQLPILTETKTQGMTAQQREEMENPWLHTQIGEGEPSWGNMDRENVNQFCPGDSSIPSLI